MKQNAKQVLSSVEAALSSMVTCSQRVPTNTADTWYHELRALGTEVCSLEFNQSADNRWIRVTLRFSARIVSQRPDEPRDFIQYSLLNIDTPEVLIRYDKLRRLTIYLTERVGWVRMPNDYKPPFGKRLEFTFSRATLTSEYAEVGESLKRLLADVDNEAELIAEDNLAKGRLIHLVRLFAQRHQTEERYWWAIPVDALRCPVESHHPTEYWGSVSLPEKNLISDSDQFPWMPVAVSQTDIPF